MSEHLDILEISRSWSYWDRPIPASIPRQVALPKALDDKLCLVVQGVRRCGKSTLLQQLIGRYGLDPTRCAFLNLEDPRLCGRLSFEVLEALVTGFRARHPGQAPLYFFLDEIQGVAGWERWLRSQIDRPQGNVFVLTGSNATLLSGELSSVLTGRHQTVELFPFDFAERRALDPKASLEAHLQQGGFPLPLLREDGDPLLRQLFDDIIERDIRERLRARSTRAIRQLAQMSFEAAGSELSLRRAAAATGIATDTAGSYLEACEAAYLLFAVPYFAYSERKRSSHNRKFYPVDSGLRRAVVTRGGRDLGKALECATFLELRRRKREVFYWRDPRGAEVDFVVQEAGEAVPYQVTWAQTEPRHERALEVFYEAFPRAAEAVFVNADTFEQHFASLPSSPRR